jgi:threonine/homoserine/homoserine lactone efflux protein
MENVAHIVVPAITGFISGMLLSIPVGPVNLTIMNEGARRGFAWAAMIGLGATLMEVLYCTIAFTGFSTLFGNRVVKASMELFSFVFLLFLGTKFLLAKTVVSPTHISKATDRIEERIEEKLHPHSAFMTGFVRVLANPGVLLFWIILAANFISREWVLPTWPSKLTCIGGVALGTGVWFLGLSYAVSLGHGKFGEKTLLKMERLSGVGLIVIALMHGAHIIWQMAHHKL